MKAFAVLFVLLVTFAVAGAEIFFKEEFGDGWENRWVVSKHKKDGTAGEFFVSPGKYYGDKEADKGLKTSKDARFFQISAEMKEFSNKDRDLIIQYSVKHEQGIDCGGAYAKILPAGLNQLDFHGESPYNIMFGPDICGGTRKVHAIVNYKGKNFPLKSPDVKAEHDEWTHLYTFILRKNHTYDILIDNKSVRKGSLIDDWDFLPPREILDPAVSKPADWVDVREIPDPAAKKPEGWDDIPQQIADKSAKRPDDWDSDLDGEWEAPMIDNPEYKGEWKHPMIPNPTYKGEWVHPKIPNPDFAEDPNVGKFDNNKYLGVEIWQVKAGTIFDNFLVTDSAATANEWAAKTVKTQEGEKAAKKAEDDKATKKNEKKDDDEGEGEEDEGDDDDDDDEDHDEL